MTSSGKYCKRLIDGKCKSQFDVSFTLASFCNAEQCLPKGTVSKFDQQPKANHGSDCVRENRIRCRLKEKNVNGENRIPTGLRSGYERIGR